jgi:hypothetical protein
VFSEGSTSAFVLLSLSFSLLGRLTHRRMIVSA